MKGFLILTALFALTASNAFAQILDFGTLPPEINSGRMYSGPGSGPMLVAAQDFQNLATFLGSGQLYVDYESNESIYSFDSGSIPPGAPGEELIFNLKSSTPDLQIDDSLPISVFDIENDYTLIQSDGTNITTQTGSFTSYEVTTVPEPSTWVMFFCGITGLALIQLHRRKRCPHRR